MSDTVKHEIHKTGSVRLRGIEPEDLPLLKEWRNQFKHFYREYRFINDPHQEKWYYSTIGDRRHIFYAIDVWDGKWWLVGQCAWSNISWVDRHAELGIYIGDDDWRGKGVGLQAMIKLHCIAFHELNMRTVRLEVFANNKGAYKFYQKFGYNDVGEYREAYYYNQMFYNSMIMDMTNFEWTQLYANKYSNRRLEVPE